MDQQLQLSLGLTLPTTAAPVLPPTNSGRRGPRGGRGGGLQRGGEVAQGVTCSHHHLQPQAQNVHIFARPGTRVRNVCQVARTNVSDSYKHGRTRRTRQNKTRS